MKFLAPFVFNGTSSFDKFWESLSGDDWTTVSSSLSQYSIKGNEILVNVAGFEKDEIETQLDIENQKIEIQTPESEISVRIPESLKIESPEDVMMKYKAGLLTFIISKPEKKEKASKFKLNFI